MWERASYLYMYEQTIRGTTYMYTTYLQYMPLSQTLLPTSFILLCLKSRTLRLPSLAQVSKQAKHGADREIHKQYNQQSPRWGKRSLHLYICSILCHMHWSILAIFVLTCVQNLSLYFTQDKCGNLHIQVLDKVGQQAQAFEGGLMHFGFRFRLGQVRYEISVSVSIEGRVRVSFFSSFRVRVRFWLGPSTRLDIPSFTPLCWKQHNPFDHLEIKLSLCT